jgi:hypothetical protein
MYTIVDVVYGIPLNRNNEEPPDRSLALDGVIDDEVLGIINPNRKDDLNGKPIAFGIVIDGFDEDCHHTEGTSVRMVPSEGEIKDFNDMFAALDPAVQQEMKEKYGEPRVFFLWSTS